MAVVYIMASALHGLISTRLIPELERANTSTMLTVYEWLIIIKYIMSYTRPELIKPIKTRGIITASIFR